MAAAHVRIAREDFDAVVFDLDGVVTQTAAVHARSWKALFDTYLKTRAAHEGRDFTSFDEKVDYRRYVDGKPRYDGVRDFLASRDIVLPEGEPTDPPEFETVCGLGNRKNLFFGAELREHGVDTYPTTISLIEKLRAAGLRTGLISSSRNTTIVLEAAGLEGLFDVQIDGLVGAELGLPGKPDPAYFLEAVRRLGVTPARTALVEDALSGVEAGRSGKFGLVIGVDRVGQADALREHGADVVVRDLGEVALSG